MKDVDTTAMRDVWGWALSWFKKPPGDPEKRAQQAALVAVYLDALRTVDTVEGLHDRYTGDSRWTLLLARERFPRLWPVLGIHATTAAAYGFRFVELATGQHLDPTSPPTWLGEWAIW